MTAPAKCPVVVFNPSKCHDSQSRKAEILDAISRAGLSVPRWEETTPDDPGRGITETALREGCDLVIACGGDGTVMACVSALAGSGVPLAILAAGTGNLLASNLNIPTDLDEALAVISQGSVRQIDVGESGDIRFAVMGGIGFDAAMLADADETLKAKIGWTAYIVSGLKHLHGPATRYSITLDGGTPFKRSAKGILIGNVGHLEAGLPVLPDARPDDGLLDVAVLAPQSLWDWTVLAAKIVARRRPDPKSLETFVARRIEITVDRAQPVEYDGDSQAPTKSLSVSVLPLGLTVCVPVAAAATATDASSPDSIEAATAGNPS